MDDDTILGIMAITALGGMLIGGTNVTYYCSAHEGRAGRIAARSGDLSQVEKKPFHHWFCYHCHWENKRAKTFKTSVLKPDVTKVTIKPVRYLDGAKQVVMKTALGERIRYVPDSHNEVTIETPKGKEIFDLREPLAPALKIANTPTPVIKGTNTLAAAAQHTRE